MKKIISLFFLIALCNFSLNAMDDYDTSPAQNASVAHLESKVNELSKIVKELQLKNEQMAELINKKNKSQGWWNKTQNAIQKINTLQIARSMLQDKDSLINEATGGSGKKAIDWVSNNPGKAIAGVAGTYVLTKGLQKAFACKASNPSIPKTKFPIKNTAFNLQEYGKNMRDL